MVMGGEGGGGGAAVEGDENSSSPNTPPPNPNVVREMVAIIESIATIGEFRRTQRKESYCLVRRMKIMLPLLEETLDLDSPIPDAASANLLKLKKAFLMAKNLLGTCSEGSKLYLVLERESVIIKFNATYDSISEALEDFPFDELKISDEVKEQIELMGAQIIRARKRTETQDLELAMDMMVVLSKQDERNADRAIIERLAKKLELQTMQDLHMEAIALRKHVRERGGKNSEGTQQSMALLNKFNQIAGVAEINDLENPVVPKSLEKRPSLIIPHEFLCPITLEIMTDPVIVATGQTYERESIQKWLDSNHRTCPKTRQTLVHLSLAPNFALKNLITQWCEKNSFQLPIKNESVSLGSSFTEQEEKISSLVEDLSSMQLEVQRKAVAKIRMLSKENPENRILIANFRAIPPLVQLLSYPDSKIREHSVTALLNLSIDEANKKSIAKEGAIPAIIEVLQKGTIEAKENSAAALFSLSMLDENKVMIGFSNGIPPLVDLLKKGTVRGKRDAVTALYNLSLNNTNKARAIDAGIVSPLLQLLGDKNLGMVDEALSIFLLLASHPDGRQEIGQLPFIETLVEFIREGTPKNKECAASVLLELGSSNSSFILAALQYGVYEHLTEIARSGTNRAQRKANSLMQLMSRSEQIP